jgi:hypothetical protein
MKKFDFWGNKKNIESINGKIIISENMERELKEIGIIDENGEYMIDKEGNKISYHIGENDFSRIFQYHIPRNEWGKTYNLISERFNDGREGRIKIIYIPEKERMEIWENEKGEKRKMILRREKDFSEIIKKWNEIQESDISEKDLIKKII